MPAAMTLWQPVDLTDWKQLSEEEQALQTSELATELLAKARQVLEEVARFRSFILENSLISNVELRLFRSTVESELKTLEKVSPSCQPFASISDRASSNPLYLYTVCSLNLRVLET